MHRVHSKHESLCTESSRRRAEEADDPTPSSVHPAGDHAESGSPELEHGGDRDRNRSAGAEDRGEPGPRCRESCGGSGNVGTSAHGKNAVVAAAPQDAFAAANFASERREREGRRTRT